MQPLRWFELSWYFPAPQVEQDRRAFLVSALMPVPLPHVGCAVHLDHRCALEVMYVLASQLWHVRSEVFCPVNLVPWPHLGWGLQLCSW